MVWQGEARQGEDSFELVVVPRFAARRGEAGHGAARQGMAGRGLF